MRISIVGATGRIGATLTRSLVSAGHQVNALSRGGPALDALVEFGATPVLGSFDTGAGKLDTFFPDADAAFLMVKTDWKNIHGHYPTVAQRFVDALRSSPVRLAVSLTAMGSDVKGSTGHFESTDDSSGCETMAHGVDIAAHFHDYGQLRYAAAGALVTSTQVGTWVAPANRITWVPPLHVHRGRSYGATQVRVLRIPEGMAEQLPPEPDLLHADPACPATLAALGRRTGASERTLSRLFNSELSMSFHQWRTLLRVQRAVVDLCEGASVTDTAMRLGWANQSSFIEAFTDLVGQTPGRYRSTTRTTHD